MNILDFQNMKQADDKIVMMTCYDYAFARILADSQVDCLLVGDSLAMVMYGYPSTVHATMDMMCLHTAAVARGAGDKFVIGDLPFMSYRQGLTRTMENVARLMQAGAQAVKLEGVDGNEDLVRHIVDSGVPVMGHLGLTPQAVHQLGGHKVQGRDDGGEARLLDQALRLQAAGCFAVVLECVPARIAAAVTAQLSIPTIGIGAGSQTSGQVLVLHDMLDFDPKFNPTLLKKYATTHGAVMQAANQYAQEVKSCAFPSSEQSYS